MSAREIGEGVTTLIGLRWTTVEALRRYDNGLGQPGYDVAITDLLTKANRPAPRSRGFVRHFKKWTWIVACRRCDWIVEIRGRKARAQSVLLAHERSHDELRDAL